MAVERWTDEMVDALASSVAQMRDSIAEVRESVVEVRDSVAEVRDSVDGLRVTSQALLQIAAQNQRDIELIKQRQLENDQRFNTILEEVRYLIRRNQQD